jgi:CBS domain-containing protein
MAQLAQEVGSLLNKAPVTVAADTSIRDAARTMTEQNVSSIMLMEQLRLVGILTDR